MARPVPHSAGRQADLERAASLAKPLRLGLFEYVLSQRHAVGRDEAAAAMGITRALAAFHLDRLARDGLLSVEYKRLSGRSGPGAGRPAKLYRRGSEELELSIPGRRYELAAEVLAAAVEQTPVASGAVGGAAATVGRRLGETRATGGGAAGSPGTNLLAILTEFGFEPSVDLSGTIELLNCPFHALRAEHQGVVCEMNRCLVDGILQGACAAGYTPSLEPDGSRCCVLLRPSTPLKV